MNKLFILIAFITLVSGCYWENEESLFPDYVSCDTLDLSFALDVVPILSNHCYGCHSNANAPAFASGLALEDHEDVSAVSARIAGAINHQNGFLPMPKGQEQLDSCQIRTIESWINQGSLNN